MKKKDKNKKIKEKKLRKKGKELIKKEKKLKREEKRLKKRKFDFNSIFGGISVGIANIIPGVSGGTMLVIFNLFDKLMFAINDIFKKKTNTRKESIKLLLKVLISAAIGIIIFAKILGFTLEYFEAETIVLFMGLILFSVPIIIKDELKGNKFSIILFLIGFLFIIGIQYLKFKNIVNTSTTDINLYHFIILVICGIIGGATMIFPGVSGSMILLVLGKYEMIRNYISELTSFNTEAFVSLCFFGIGVIIGIISSAKITNYLLNNHRGKTISTILGFIIASALILPFNIENKIDFDTLKICSIIISFIFGGIIMYYINILQKKDKLQ